MESPDPMCSMECCVEYNGGNVHDVTRFALNLFERPTKLGPHAYLPSIPLPPPLFHELVLLRVWVEGCTSELYRRFFVLWLPLQQNGLGETLLGSMLISSSCRTRPHFTHCDRGLSPDKSPKPIRNRESSV